MSHYREIMPSPYLGAWDLNGDTVVTITKVPYRKKISELQGAEKVIIELEGMKPMMANATNMKTIAKVLESDDHTTWVGKQVTLGVSKVKSVQDGDMVDAIRVRREKPVAKKAKIPADQWENALNAVKNGTWTAERLKAERDLTKQQIDDLNKVSASIKGK